MQIPSLESRVTALEAVQAQINERLGNIEHRLISLENQQASNFRWLVGIVISKQLTTLITLGTLILIKLGSG